LKVETSNLAHKLATGIRNATQWADTRSIELILANLVCLCMKFVQCITLVAAVAYFGRAVLESAGQVVLFVLECSTKGKRCHGKPKIHWHDDIWEEVHTSNVIHVCLLYTCVSYS